MDKGYNFLHNHPLTEKRLGVDEQHVIVDRDAWEEARNQILDSRIPLTVPYFSQKEIEDLAFKWSSERSCGDAEQDSECMYDYAQGLAAMQKLLLF